MLVPGIVLPFIVVVFILLFGLLIREQWRNAVVRKEEVSRLLAMASEEAALVEVEAAAEYSPPLPVVKPYQCAVCFSPTTTRCSRCKSVRYCSGKCQIVHWRQTHKYECHPSFIPMPSSGGSDSVCVPESQYELQGNDSWISCTSIPLSEDRPMLADVERFKPYVDVEKRHTNCASSDIYSSVGSIWSSAKGSSLAAASFSKVSGSSERPTLDSWAGAGFNETETTTSLDLKSSSSVHSVNEAACSSKLNKMNCNHMDEVVHLNTQLPKAKIADGALLSDDTVEYDTKLGGLSYVKCLKSDTIKSVPNDKTSGSNISRLRSANASNDDPSLTARARANPNVKFAEKYDGIRRPHATMHDIPSFQHGTHNGLKASVQKVVQQPRASKNKCLKTHVFGLGSEIDGKCNYKMLFPYELFERLYSYRELELYPFGLINCGNSCYANAMLQCLAFTRPLSSYLLQGIHSKACQKRQWCFICEFESLILRAKEGESPLSPIRILSQIQKIGSHLGHGREEDAHEFLRYAVETMQSVCLKEAGVGGQLAEETSLVGLTFGGYLRSKIKCMKCLGKSEHYEKMMDLTVEIDGDITTLEEALAQFTATEVLDGENKYHCCRCRSYEKAKKKLTVLDAPNVLTIVLKRFQSGNLGKLSKPIQYPEDLDIAPYMSGTSEKSPPLYHLYAVVVHLDFTNAAFSGHYVCYVKNSKGQWFKIDDSTVTPVDPGRVFSEGAYILLYARDSPRPPALRNVLKRRNPEPVPPSAISRLKLILVKPSMEDPSLSKLKKHHHNQSFGPGERRNNSMADSASESSSLFSCSDVSSWSTDSTKDSANAEDLSDYLFGEGGSASHSPHWPLSHSDRPLSFSSSRSSPFSDPGLASVSHGEDEDEGKSPFLYTNPTKHGRKSAIDFGSSSSSRGTVAKWSVWANPFSSTKFSVLSRRSSRRGSLAQSFY